MSNCGHLGSRWSPSRCSPAPQRQDQCPQQLVSKGLSQGGRGLGDSYSLPLCDSDEPRSCWVNTGFCPGHRLDVKGEPRGPPKHLSQNERDCSAQVCTSAEPALPCPLPVLTQGENLPQQDPKGPHVTLRGVHLVEDALGGHPLQGQPGLQDGRVSQWGREEQREAKPRGIPPLPLLSPGLWSHNTRKALWSGPPCVYSDGSCSWLCPC